MSEEGAQSLGGTDRGTGFDIEDHGSDVTGVNRLVCGLNGCNRTPKFAMRGYIHFTFDGTSYSCDRLKLCKAHKTVLNRSVDTATDHTEADR